MIFQSNWLSSVRLIHESHHFCPKRISLSANERPTPKIKQPVNPEGLFKVINQIAGK